MGNPIVNPPVYRCLKCGRPVSDTGVHTDPVSGFRYHSAYDFKRGFNDKLVKSRCGPIEENEWK